ncbi:MULTISPECIES: hypothetical protein [unclassified Paraburkholderia]|uniref:hypothetical protein n=1 Tax=unclassified Paraburkholderia TaxID=2615204 RepID=UPI001FB988CE|nr:MULTISPECIES: hypothetical protein [unclassified Paraburkholderia]
MAAVLPAAFSAAVPVLALPAADVLAELFGPAVPAWAAAVLAAPLLPPPPPHPASARESVERRSSCDFINL